MTVRREDEIIAAGNAGDVKRESARRTRRSFLTGGVAAAAAAGAAYLVDHSRPAGELQSGLRAVLNANAAVTRGLFRERALAPTYDVKDAVPLRLNGTVGLDDAIDAASWRLQMVGVNNAPRFSQYVPDVTAWEYRYAGDLGANNDAEKTKTAPGAAQPQAASATGAGTIGAALARGLPQKRNRGDAEAGPSSSSLDIGTPGLLLSMADVQKLPRVSFVTQFKCIEGWSSITEWAGVRLRDLIEAYPPQRVNGRMPRYVYMETPTGDFYTGYNMSAALHPQSLLVTEMGGQPLTQEHGAPLRLHMPIKYGYKQIKRIGLIAYMDTKPDDYWTRLGYDWYAGL